MERVRYLNGVLTVLAVLLGVIALNQSGLLGPTSATAAQPDRGTGLVSAADQRKEMIEELRRLSARVERLEKALQKGVEVRVTSLPEIKQQGGGDGQ